MRLPSQPVIDELHIHESELKSIERRAPIAYVIGALAIVACLWAIDHAIDVVPASILLAGVVITLVLMRVDHHRRRVILDRIRELYKT